MYEKSISMETGDYHLLRGRAVSQSVCSLQCAVSHHQTFLLPPPPSPAAAAAELSTQLSKCDKILSISPTDFYAFLLARAFTRTLGRHLL